MCCGIPLLLQVALEDSLVTMSTILASRFVAGIRSEVERVEKQLNVFSDTLDQWVQVRTAYALISIVSSWVWELRSRRLLTTGIASCCFNCCHCLQQHRWLSCGALAFGNACRGTWTHV
jgi:hypothetical protein